MNTAKSLNTMPQEIKKRL